MMNGAYSGAFDLMDTQKTAMMMSSMVELGGTLTPYQMMGGASRGPFAAGGPLGGSGSLMSSDGVKGGGAGGISPQFLDSIILKVADVFANSTN